MPRTSLADTSRRRFAASAVRARLPLLLVALLSLSIPASAAAARCGRAGWAAGAAAVDVTPRPPAGHTLAEVNLGGYGFGAGRAASWVRGRVYARAWVTGCATTGGRLDPRHAVAIEEIDNQGMQVAYASGPYGTQDIRAAAARATHLPRSAIVVASNHSHAGPDLIGVWGFVPEWYLRQVRDGGVRAFVRAVRGGRSAHLVAGEARAPELVHTQFNDPAVGVADRVDDTVRVVRAVTRRGRVLGTLVAFAAHSTVMGGANRGLSPDWTGALALRLERRRPLWGTVVVLEGTNGKTQPDRPVVPAPYASRPEMTSRRSPLDADGYALAAYAQRVARRVGRAAQTAHEVRGRVVSGATRLFHEKVTNALLLSLLQGPGISGARVQRAHRAPWSTGADVGSLAGALRVGDLLIATVPGEAYPAVEHTVAAAAAPTIRHAILAGLADDQLGYLIAPQAEYATAAREAAENGNDNTLFNVSPRIGDHVTCTVLDALRATDTRPATRGPDCAALGGSTPAP